METIQNQDIIPQKSPNQTNKKKFTDTIGFKILIIVPMLLLLLIPTSLVQNLVSERQYYSRETIQRIAGAWGKEQVFRLPSISVPYQERGYNGKWVNNGATEYLSPENTIVSVEMFPEIRKYGIYKCIIYRAFIKVEGNMQLNLIDSNTRKYNLNKAILYFSECSSFSGKFNGKELTSTNVSSLINVNGNNSFEIDIELKGISALSFVPSGKSTITVSAAWGDVGFEGILPDTKNIDENNFTATWDNIEANNNPTVKFINMVDHYQLTMRSVKFSMLFIILTFAVMLLVEILSKKNINIFQYVLVSIALILYYLLLLSFSEIIGFGLAYLLASIATISLLLVFFATIVKEFKSTIAFSGILIALYSFWYLLLQLENYALLAGSIFSFIVLAVAMYFSVKISKTNKLEK